MKEYGVIDVSEWFDEEPKEHELSNDLYLA